MKTLSDFKKQEAEFREHTRKWIKKVDDGFRELEEKQLKAKPLRHPNGKTHTKHDRKYFWGDALWCQDRGTEPFQLFFEIEDDEMMEIFDDCSGPVWDWISEIFDAEFRELCPDIKEVLEG